MGENQSLFLPFHATKVGRPYYLCVKPLLANVKVMLCFLPEDYGFVNKAQPIKKLV
jgi:hypothetical protein